MSHYGIKFIGPNGRSILLPAAGLRNSKGKLIADNELCTYWMSTNLNSTDVPVAILLETYLDATSYRGPVYYQIPIRPVYEETSGSSSGNGGGESGQTQPETSSAGNAVDLGLSVLWADRNVGSSSATAVGSYIRWGETNIPNPEDYSQDSYSLY